MAKRVPTGKFAMTIIGAHLTGVVPNWVNGAEVVCRDLREVHTVRRYTKKADLTVTWHEEAELQIATLSF